MADLSRSNAEWTSIARRLGWWLRAGRVLEEMRDRFREERTQIHETDPSGNSGGAVTLSGVVYGSNTDERGRLFVRISGSGPYTIDLFKQAGGSAGNKVATGSAAAGAAASLAAANDSGLTGSYTFDSSVSADSSDAHILEVYLDNRKDAGNVYDGTDTITGDDSRSLAVAYRFCDTVAASLDAALAAWESEMSAWAVGGGTNARGQLAEWLKDQSTSLISSTANDDGSGTITRRRSGTLESFRACQQDESGTTQTIIRRQVAATSPAAATGNGGTVAITVTLEEHAPAGRYVVECVEGLGTGAGGSEQFSLTAILDDDTVKTHTQRATVGQSYTGEDGVSLSIARSPSKTGDGSNTVLAAATGLTFVGEGEGNTSSGVLHWVTTASSVAFYSSSNTIDANKVAEATGLSGGGASFTASQANNSGLTVVGALGSSPGAGSGTIDLRYAQTENASKIPDSFDFTVSETSTGKAARVVASLLGYKLHSAAAGAETLSDDMLAQAGTWPPFVSDTN